MGKFSGPARLFQEDKILVIGCNGSMGRRYMALLRHLCVPHLGIDKGDDFPGASSFTRAIVATPTETHFQICKKLIELGKDFLCEKPVSKDPDVIKELRNLAWQAGIKAHMVCNWAFIFGPDPLNPLNNRVYYDFYNTGSDGFYWDCIQLIYLQKEGSYSIARNSPHFMARINNVPVTLEDVSRSYEYMLRDWLITGSALWRLEQAEEATRKVIAFENFFTGPMFRDVKVYDDAIRAYEKTEQAK